MTNQSRTGDDARERAAPGATADDPLLAVRNLSVRFPSSAGDVVAVQNMNLQVARGEAVGIVGESGSGKSMTALALLGLIPQPGEVVSGSVEFMGSDLITRSAEDMRTIRLRDIAMIFQDAGSYLNPVFRIKDQIAEAIGHGSARNPQVYQQVLAALKAVRIADPERVANAYPHELSGGMQQRALIASVLIRKPKLIIADEPTTALDATVQYQILKFLHELRREIDAAIILISHDLAVISEVCDRVYVMYAGQIVEEAGAAEIFAEPKHPYTQALIASILDPFETTSVLTPLEGSPPDMAAPPSGCRFHPRCRQRFEPCDRVAPDLYSPGARQSVRCLKYAPESA